MYGEIPGLLAGTAAALKTYKLGRVKGDEVILLDVDTPFAISSVPPSIDAIPHLRQGLDYLCAVRPRVVMLHSYHRGKGDLTRQAAEGLAYFGNCPVAGVEAMPATPISTKEIAAPARGGGWLGKFHDHQFPWLASKNIIALPCDLHVNPNMIRIAGVYQLTEHLMNGRADMSSEVVSQLKYIVFALQQIYRAWGIVGQFGWWLQHPRVQELMRDCTARVPLVLGSMHQLEVRLLREFCGVDTVLLDTSHEAADVTTEEMGFSPESVLRYENLVPRHINDGAVLIRDVQEAFPF